MDDKRFLLMVLLVVSVVVIVLAVAPDKADIVVTEFLRILVSALTSMLVSYMTARVVVKRVLGK